MGWEGGAAPLPQATSRSLAAVLARSVKDLPAAAVEECGRWFLARLAPQASAFEEAEAATREVLYDALLAEGAYREAAQVLAGLRLEGATWRPYSDAEKADTYVKIAETFLEEDESVEAEVFVNKASALMAEVPAEDWALRLRFRVTLARTLDARRKFLDAAMRYYELSQADHEAIPAEDLITLLSKAVTCALLGNAGPQRSRILGLLYKDERLTSHMAQSENFAATAQMLRKMFTGQIVRRPETAAFEATLMPHQKALVQDGLSIPERATIQHNLVALSAIYHNISFKELGTLLQLDPEKAEALASKMIAQGRLNAKLDQVASTLHFLDSPHDDAAHKPDEALTRVCLTVNACYDRIRKHLDAE